MLWLFRQGMDAEVMLREYVWVPVGTHPLVRSPCGSDDGERCVTRVTNKTIQVFSSAGQESSDGGVAGLKSAYEPGFPTTALRGWPRRPDGGCRQCCGRK